VKTAERKKTINNAIALKAGAPFFYIPIFVFKSLARNLFSLTRNLHKAAVFGIHRQPSMIHTSMRRTRRKYIIICVVVAVQGWRSAEFKISLVYIYDLPRETFCHARIFPLQFLPAISCSGISRVFRSFPHPSPQIITAVV